MPRTCSNCLRGGILVGESGKPYEFLSTNSKDHSINYASGHLGCRDHEDYKLLATKCINSNFKYHLTTQISPLFNDFYLNVELLDKSAKTPSRAFNGDAGLDFYTPVDFSIP